VIGVHCASAGDCIAIVSDGTLLTTVRTTTFGQTWQQEGNLPGLFLGASDLTCTAADSCLAAGYVPTSTGHGEGSVAISTDGGQTWSLATVPAGLGLLQSVACASASVCLAVGTTSTTASDVVPAAGEVVRSTDGGHTWVLSTHRPPVDDAYGIACPSPATCAMVGTKWSGQPPIGNGAVAESADGGTTFRPAPSAYVPLTLTAVSCPTTVSCVAVGGDTVASITLAQPSAPAQPVGSSTTGPAGRTRPAPVR
jgi:hypothetical protein